MTRQEMIDYAKQFAGAEYEYKTSWEADVLTVGGKMFAFAGEDKQGTRIINLKNLPKENMRLRAEYPNWVMPGYYSNKDHWNSWLWTSKGFDFELLKQQIDISYELVWSSLTKKKQTELLEKNK